jgi:type IV pilus assembly protein PilQ
MQVNQKFKQVIICLLLFFAVQMNSKAQDRYNKIETELAEQAKTQKGLNNPVNISVNHSSLQEIVRAIALENNLNVSVDVSIIEQPSYNFADATVADVFLFLCKEHDLYLSYTGNIIAFKKYVAPEAAPAVFKAKKVNLTFNKNTGFINADLSRDTLYRIVRKLSKESGKNIQVDSKLHSMLVTMTIVNQDLEAVVNRLAGSNEVNKVSDNFYTILKVEEESQSGKSTGRGGSRNGRKGKNKKSRQQTSDADIVVEKVDSGFNLTAFNTPLVDIVEELSREAGVSFFLFSEPKGDLTVNVSGRGYEEVLEYVLNTSDYTYKNVDGIYMIGERKDESLRYTTVYQLQYRTTDKVIDVIPTEIKKGVEVKEFVELNSIVLSGSQPQIKEIIAFLKKVDQVVPVVLIEVMIVDISKSHNTSSGLKIGRDASVGSSGSFGTSQPGETRVTFNQTVLNTIVNAVSNLGIFNLGNVGPGFYVEMSALEANGALKLHSTPKLATMNGHEATLSVGETKYYAQDQTNLIGAQTPQVVTTKTYQSVNADLAITIKPMVSGNDQITLEVSVSQSSFGKQVGEAPPEFTTREFQSLIRMKNQEMVVLGGLEQNTKEKSASGVPWLSRIPVIKWFFSNTENKKSDSKLTIFIRPTVIY